jgi:hypothetical protein
MSTDERSDEIPDFDDDAPAGHWLDAMNLESWSDESAIDAHRAADLAFLDALLMQLYSADRRATDRRVERVVAALASEPLPAATLAGSKQRRFSRDRRRWLVAAAALAAGLIMMTGMLFWSAPSSRVAQAAVQEAILTASQPRDLQYTVRTRVRTLRDNQTEFEAMLYVRGAERFALHHPGFLGDLWIGGNGHQYWIKPAIGPPQIVDELQRPLRWAGTNTFGLPELQISGLLALLVHEYDLTLVDDDSSGSPMANSWQHVRGVQRTGSTEHPQLVELWADRQSGVARRLELVWHLAASDAGLEHVTIEFVGETPQDDSWYDATSHLTILPKLPRSPLLFSSGE